MRLSVIFLATLIMSVAEARGAGFNVPAEPLSRSEFERLARQAGHAFSFPVVDHADAYGLTGFDIGLGLTSTPIDSPAVPNRVSIGYVRAVKGLPFGLDVGGMYGTRLGGDETVVGGELKYAILEDGVALPALGLRAAYTHASRLSSLGLNTASLQAELSKSLVFVTPYAGGGYALAVAKPSSAAVSTESVNAGFGQVWAGLKIKPLPFIAITLHAQMGLGDAPLLLAAQVSAGL